MQLAFSLTDLFYIGNILINFNSATNTEELGRLEVHDFGDIQLIKSLTLFK